MKKILSIPIFLLMLCAAVFVATYAEDGEGADKREIMFGGGFVYVLNDGQATIIGTTNSEKFEWLFDEEYGEMDGDYDDYDTDYEYETDSDGDIRKPLKIPRQVDGYPVVAIGEEAFLETLYTDYIIAEGIVSIGDYAFAYCYYFDTIVIPNGVTSIGKGAFMNCENLETVVLPDCVTYIGVGAFGTYYGDFTNDDACDWFGRLIVAEGSYAEKYAQENGYSFVYGDSTSSFGSGVNALTIDNLATRSGPSTKYRETGTYKLNDEYVRVISLAYDGGGVCWVQCEVPYGNKLRRVYTGFKRFDADSFDVYDLPEEDPSDEAIKVITTSKAMYGPGDGYDIYGSLTVDKGQTVTVITVENGYAQVEWTTSQQSYRAWVPVSTLDY